MEGKIVTLFDCHNLLILFLSIILGIELNMKLLIITIFVAILLAQSKSDDGEYFESLGLIDHGN